MASASAAHRQLPQYTSYEQPQDEEDELDVVDDEDVDQLDSDEGQDAAASSTSSRSEPPVPRIPGETTIPTEHLWRMAQHNFASASMSNEGFFLLSVAAEEFIHKLTEAGQLQAKMEGRTNVTYEDLAFSTQQHQELMFLKDTIPEPIPLKDALKRREQKLKEGPLEALVMSTPVAGSMASTIVQSAKGKTKARASGSSRANSDTTYKKPRTRDPKGRYGQPSAPGTPTNGVAAARPRRSRTRQTSTEDDDDETPPPPRPGNANGHAHAPWDAPPMHLSMGPAPAPAHPGEPDTRWTSGAPQYIAAQFVQEEPWQRSPPRQPAGYAPNAGAPAHGESGPPRRLSEFGGDPSGRTIYSQRR